MFLWQRAGMVEVVLLTLAVPAWAKVAPRDQLPKDDIFRRTNPDDMTSKALVLDVHPEWPILVVGTVEQRQMQPRPAGLRRGGQKPLLRSGQGLYPRRGHRRHRRHRQGRPASGDGEEPAGRAGAQAGLPRSARRCRASPIASSSWWPRWKPGEGERWTLDDEAIARSWSRRRSPGSNQRPLIGDTNARPAKGQESSACDGTLVLAEQALGAFRLDCHEARNQRVGR